MLNFNLEVITGAIRMIRWAAHESVLGDDLGPKVFFTVRCGAFFYLHILITVYLLGNANLTWA